MQRPSLELESAIIITGLFANSAVPNGSKLALYWSHSMDLAWVWSVVQIDRPSLITGPTLCKLCLRSPSVSFSTFTNLRSPARSPTRTQLARVRHFFFLFWIKTVLVVDSNETTPPKPKTGTLCWYIWMCKWFRHGKRFWKESSESSRRSRNENKFHSKTEDSPCRIWSIWSNWDSFKNTENKKKETKID